MNKVIAYLTSNRRLAAIVLSCTAAMLSFPGLARATNPFNIDGNVPDAGCCVEFADPSGNAKELGAVNGTDTKLGVIHTAPLPMLDFTNPNSSTDIVKIWLETRKDEDEDVWLYFAWERDANTGSSVISYEFQAAAPDAACDYTGTDQIEPIDGNEANLIAGCNPWSNRQQDDFLIVWDFNGGATDIILRTFDGVAFDAGVNISGAGYAFASLNNDSSRGEGAINLTDAFFSGLDSCFNVANVIPGTVTGNSDQADYKDTVLADAGSVLTISNCGTVNISKATLPPGETGNFPYTLARSSGAYIDYTPRVSATGTLVDDGASAQVTVIPGTDYLLTEELAGEPAFQLQSILCNRPAPDTDGSNGFTVAVSETTDCVITNELLLGTVTVIKQVANEYGGTSQPSDFCLSLNDDDNTASFPGSDSGTQFTFIEGNQYSVTEVPCGNPDTSPPGYASSLSGDCTGMIEGLTDKVCTVTNTQQPQAQAALTLYKDLSNDNGGTAEKSAWTLSATLKDGAPGTCTIDGLSGSDSGSGVAGAVSASDALAQCIYVLSETGGPASGYTAGEWSCSGDFVLNGSELAVGSGGAACTITNDDDVPSLTLVKNVSNDNGGAAVASDWTLTADGPTPIAGAGGASSDGTFSAGTYSLSEDGPAGYSASAWSCVGGSQNGNAITLGLGESATCTITNDDIQPLLTVIKTVVNDNGGTMTVDDFELFVDAVQVTSGVTNGFNAGSYTVSESSRAGYTAGAWGGDCAADGTVSLAISDNKTCTITNDDLPPELKIVKTPDDAVLIPGDDAVFTITVTNIGGGDAVGVTLSDTLPNPASPLTWATTTPGCVIAADGVTLSCDIGTLAKDPTPDQKESGDEASFTVTVAATISSSFFDPSANPGGAGSLGSNFEIDGDLTADGASPLLDWDSAELSFDNKLDPPLISLFPFYVDDNSFGEGTKEDDAVPVVVDSPVPPNKSDLTNFLITEDVVDDNVFLVLGWLRANSLGNANFDFELNQSQETSANGITPVRTDRDVMISFDFETGGDEVVLTLREWDATALAWGPPRDLNSEGTAHGAVNDPIAFGTAPNGETNTLTGGVLVDNTFGEAIIDLTQTFTQDCRKFVSAYVKGRSSTSFTSALKDFITPFPVEIFTCRTVSLPNTATADATNPGQDTVSDSGSIRVTNDPGEAGDTDGDGILNYADPDDDNDGVADASDLCPATAVGLLIDANGCADVQVDRDADGFCDIGAPSSGPSACEGRDNCPVDKNPDQLDGDRDGIGDVCDAPTALMTAMPDTNGNGYDEVVVLMEDSGSGDYIASVQDSQSGIVISQVNFGSEPVVSLDTIDDIDGNGHPELAALALKLSGHMWVQVRDSVAGNLINAIYYGTSHAPVDMAVVPDTDGNGVAEIAVLGVDSTGLSRLLARDALSGAVTSKIFISNKTTLVDISIMADISGNGMPEIVFHGRDTSLNQVKAHIRDFSTGENIRNIFFGTLYEPVQLHVVNDLSGDGLPDLCQVGRRLDTGTIRMLVMSSSDGEVVSKTFAGNTDHPIDSASVADMNGNGAPEMALLVQVGAGVAKITISDGATGSFIRDIFPGSMYEPQGMVVVRDMNANGRAELAVAGNTATIPSVQISDSDSGEQLKLIVLP
jgi:uncharacterized repeat protein (TIGR01451 family)